MRSFAINTLTVAGSILFTVLALEIILRLLPIAAAPWVQPPTPDNPIQRYVPNASFTWSLGWNFQDVVRGRTNAQGFVADYDYDASAASPLVALIGDSFIEALMVPFRDSITGRLQKALGTRGRAYSIAQSGSPLSQYIAYARHACERYRPQRMVIAVVGNDFDESVFANRQRNGIFHLRPGPNGFDHVLTPLPPMGLAERLGRSSALALYLVRNVSRGSLFQAISIGRAQASTEATAYVGNTSAAAGTERVAEGERVVDWFFKALSDPSMCLRPRDIVIVVDAMRPEIYEPAKLPAARLSYFGRMRAKVLADAAARGFAVVDLEADFRASFEKDQQRFEPLIDNHWNAKGHAVAAEAIAARLADWPPLAAR